MTLVGMVLGMALIRAAAGWQPAVWAAFLVSPLPLLALALQGCRARAAMQGGTAAPPRRRCPASLRALRRP